MYENWQTLFPNCTRCLVQHLSQKGKSLLYTVSFYGALSLFRAMAIPLLGYRDNGFFKRWGCQPHVQRHLCHPALFISFSGWAIQTSKIYKYFTAFRKYGMILASFTKAQLLRGIERMHPLRNPATFSVLRSAIKQQQGRTDRQSQLHLNQFIART